MKRTIRNLLLPAMALLLLSTAACTQISYGVKGRVVDAETEEPIEGAVVSVLWYHQPFGPPGLATGHETLGVYERITDADGYFETRKRLGGKFKIGAYKKGYVGWSDNRFFNPEETYHMHYGTPRENRVPLEGGMIIRLHPFRDEKNRKAHADYVDGILSSVGGARKFRDATRDERRLRY